MEKCRVWSVFVVVGFVLTGCERADPQVSYSADVAPVLAENCLSCHQPGAAGYEASGFGVESYAALMKGTKFGPVVIPGDAFTSNLVVLIEGRAHSSIRMPHGEQKIAAEDIETVKLWVDQGALDN